MHPENALERFRPRAIALAGVISVLLTLCMFTAPDAGAQPVSDGSDDQGSTESEEPKTCGARGVDYDPGEEVILITIVERPGHFPTITVIRFICDEDGNWRRVAERRTDKRPVGLKRATLTVKTATGTKRMTGGLKIPRSTLDGPAVGPVMRSSR